MTALALRDDQVRWDEGQLAVLRATGIDEDVSEAELNAFLHECQRRRLDPFIRQIYLLGRYDKRKRRKVYRSQTSIDGFRLISRRAADDAKESIEYEDTLWCGADGRWTDVWLAPKPPAACKVIVLRAGKRFPATARFSAYVQVDGDGNPMGLWQKMPDGQLAKCTEALALRKAFPEELGSLYTDDEMAQADNPQGVRVVSADVLGGGADGHQHDPAAEQAGPPPERDEAWLADATEKAAGLPDTKAATKLWKDIAGKLAEGAITKADADHLAVIVKARVEDLKPPPPDYTPDDADVMEGVIVADPGDPDGWTAKAADILTAEDAEAAAADLAQVFKGGSMTRERRDEVHTAILERAAALAGGAA